MIVNSSKLPGLKSLESRVFLSLASTGETTAKNIAASTNTDRADVYRTLNALQQKGLVTAHLNKPKTFKAVSLDNALEILQDHSRAEATRIKDEMAKLKRATDSPDKTPDDKTSLIMWNQANLPKSIRRHWIEAQTSVDMFMDDQPESIKSITQAIILNNGLWQQALKRKVRFRLIVAPTVKNKAIGEILNQLMKYPNFELKVGIFPLSNFAVFDEKKVTIDTGKKSGYNKETIAMNYEAVTQAFHSVFDEIWKKAST